LKRLGTVLHTVDNLLVVRADKTVNAGVLTGAAVITRSMKKIGKIKEFFGPVKSPYISIKIFKEIKDPELARLQNERVYLA